MRYFVVGYFGYKNTGDDDLLRQTLTLLLSVDSDAQITIGMGPNNPIKESKTFKFIDRFSVSQLIKSIQACDIVIFGGGSLFQDHTSLKSLIYYTGIIALSRFHRRKIVLLGHGFSPPRTRIGHLMLQYCINSATAVTCRDLESTQLATRISRNLHLHTASDLAIYSRTVSIHSHYSDRIAVSARPYQSITLAPLAHAISTYKTRMIGISLQEPDDRIATSALGLPTEQITSLNHSFPHLPLGWIPPKMVVAMRYHACIWAALNGIPFIAIAYDAKVAAIATELGQLCVDLRFTQPIESISNGIIELDDNIEHYRQSLMKSMPKLQDRSKLHASILTPCIT